MTDDIYTVRINRSEGMVEISGPDKDWISEQLDKVAPLLAAPAPQGSPKPQTADAQRAPKTEPDTRSRSRRSAARAERKPELEQKLTPEVTKKLQAYVDERAKNWKAQTNQVAIIATFLLDELGWSQVDEDDIYTVYVKMGWQSPGKPRSTLENARGRNGYFGAWSDGKLQLSHKGENFGRSLPTAD